MKTFIVFMLCCGVVGCSPMPHKISPESAVEIVKTGVCVKHENLCFTVFQTTKVGEIAPQVSVTYVPCDQVKGVFIYRSEKF